MKLSHTLLALILFTLSLHAQSPAQNVRVNDDGAGAEQGGARIAVDGSGTIYVAWTDFRANDKGDIYLSRSTDGGATFSQNRPVYTGGAVPAGMERGVAMALDSLGGIHMVWMETKRSSLPELRYTRSTDGGATFSDPIYIGGPKGVSAQDFPSIGVDAAGTIYVAWVDDREPRAGTGTNTQIYLTRSIDRGATFSAPIRASTMPGGVGGSCECCNTSMAVSPGGHVYISFRSNINNRRDIFVARSMNGGESFDTAIPAASERWMLQACPMSGSAIALDAEETAHIVWRDSRPSSKGKDYIYHAMLFSGADACTPDMEISSTPSRSNYPTIAITPQGAIYCAFQDNRNDLSDILAVYSLDGGNTFTSASRVVDDGGSASQVEVTSVIGPDGARYSVWHDERRDAGDIYFAKDRSPLTLAAPDRVTPLSPADGATLTSFNTFSWGTPSNFPDPRNVAYDLTIIRDGVATVVSDLRSTMHAMQLSAGSYSWYVTAHTATGRAIPSDTFSFILQPNEGAVTPAILPNESPALRELRVMPGARELLVAFGLGAPARVSFALASVDGSERMAVGERMYGMGEQAELLDIGALPSGLYLVEMRVVGRREVGKFVLAR